MIRIEPSFIRNVATATSHADLLDPLQHAVELEHATLPPYLTAMMSLKAGTNAEVREILRSVVMEEMLHMCIAANVLNALGGAPAIDQPAFIPIYPGPLPMGVADGMQIPLEAYSPDVVERVFMAIEDPEDPIVFEFGEEPPPEKCTIGLFYTLIIDKLGKIGGPLPGDPARQVTYPSFLPADELFAIENVDDAIRGLELIIAQGEGTKTSPLDPEGDYAHYYRFQQLAVGRRLIPDASQPLGYSFSGPDIEFDAHGVWPLSASTHIDDIAAGSTARQLAERFNFAYSKLLAGLHRTFNGEPSFLPETLSLMYDVKLVGERLASTPFPGRPGTTVGPPFQFSSVYH